MPSSNKTDHSDGPESPHSVGFSDARTVRLFAAGQPGFVLQSGACVSPIDVEFETYGALNSDRSNAVLIAHALTGDAHVAGWDRKADKTGRTYRTSRPGWWDSIVGPGKAIDTRKFFVLCANVLGSCYGTTGPQSPHPADGKPYGIRFPVVTVGDWVRLQAKLLDHLGIERLHAVVGGSLGGQQAIEWAMAFPNRVNRCLVLTAAPRLSTQGLAFNAVGRFSILNDPHFRKGQYYGHTPPSDGLAAARMLAHITYLSERGMHERFGRRLQNKKKPDFGFGIEFAVESYLDYQGRRFVERFDANSYLYISRAMDYYDAAQQWGDGDLVKACRRIRSRMFILSVSSDWLYPPEHCREFAFSLSRAGKPVTYVTIHSENGHDAFLVQPDTIGPLIQPFLERERPSSPTEGNPV